MSEYTKFAESYQHFHRCVGNLQVLNSQTHILSNLHQYSSQHEISEVDKQFLCNYCFPNKTPDILASESISSGFEEIISTVISAIIKLIKRIINAITDLFTTYFGRHRILSSNAKKSLSIFTEKYNKLQKIVPNIRINKKIPMASNFKAELNILERFIYKALDNKIRDNLLNSKDEIFSIDYSQMLSIDETTLKVIGVNIQEVKNENPQTLIFTPPYKASFSSGAALTVSSSGWTPDTYSIITKITDNLAMLVARNHGSFKRNLEEIQATVQKETSDTTAQNIGQRVVAWSSILDTIIASMNFYQLVVASIGDTLVSALTEAEQQ